MEDYSELDDIKNELKGCLCAFTGNSGVGKSTLINALSGNLQLETGEISDKLGRGRHTTRQAEIFPVGEGLVIDTAGFSSIDFTTDNRIYSDELQYYFNEFSEHIDECRFTGCRHLGDKGCKICEMTENGVISKSRYESYVTMYNELKSIKKWQLCPHIHKVCIQGKRGLRRAFHLSGLPNHPVKRSLYKQALER